MFRFSPVLAALLMVVFTGSVRAAEEEKILNIGDPAPALKLSAWVKGDKVEKFEPGKTYVVRILGHLVRPVPGQHSASDGTSPSV